MKSQSIKGTCQNFARKRIRLISDGSESVQIYCPFLQFLMLITLLPIQSEPNDLVNMSPNHMNHMKKKPITSYKVCILYLHASNNYYYSSNS